VNGTSGADILSGFSNDNTIFGFDGNDTINDNSGGNDIIDGGSGDDTITDNASSSGTNLLKGADGNDTIYIGNNNRSTVEGGTGNDLIQMIGYNNSNSSAQSNTFIGGAGNDRIVSGGSADTYQFGRGDGQDSILDLDAYNNQKTDTIIFGADITQSNLAVTRSGNHLVIKINDPANTASTDQITIENWYSSSTNQIEMFQFADNSTLTAAEIVLIGVPTV
jgi:Ca2+-binding RTX toxin-like protein